MLVYHGEDTLKQEHRHAATVATMAKLVTPLCFLLMMVYFVDGHSQSDDQLLRNSVVALQSKTQQMMTEITKLREEIASSNEGREHLV